MILSSRLSELNSMTKYPSIPTFHEIGDKGRLNNSYIEAPDTELVYTEKVDGTNARIVIVPDDATIIGSREDFLHGLGDLIFNPAQNIVETIREHAQNATGYFSGTNNLIVLFGEVYGESIGKAAKNYTRAGNRGFRLFDVIEMPLNQAETISAMSRPDISTWRETFKKQPFVNEQRLREIASNLDLELTPRLSCTHNSRLPASVESGLNWLQSVVDKTHCNLDIEAYMKPEGVVVRSVDRSFIAKIRYEDYERSMRSK